MPVETITLNIPDTLYQRLRNTARAARVPLEEIVLRALQNGSPPGYDDIPAEFQADIAALDRLEDNTLWQIARSQKTEAEMERYNFLLDGNQDRIIANCELRIGNCPPISPSRRFRKVLNARQLKAY